MPERRDHGADDRARLRASRPDAGAAGDEDERRPFIDRFIMPYFEDSALWPVLIVVIAHVVAFISPVLLFAIRDHSLGAVAGLLGLAALSVKAVLHERSMHGGLGAIAWAVVTTWLLSGSVAYWAARYDFM